MRYHLFRRLGQTCSRVKADKLQYRIRIPFIWLVGNRETLAAYELECRHGRFYRQYPFPAFAQERH